MAFLPFLLFFMEYSKEEEFDRGFHSILFGYPYITPPLVTPDFTINEVVFYLTQSLSSQNFYSIFR